MSTNYINKKNCFILIPVYNEGKSIFKVINQIKKLGYKNIIIIDDGSTDKESKSLGKKGVYYARHCTNLGQGASLGTGWKIASLLGAKCLIAMDGDGQHDPGEINKFINKINRGYDVVLGRRKFDGEVPLFNRIATEIAKYLMWAVYGIWVNDSQSGFRAYSKKAIDDIAVEASGYEFNSKVIAETVRKKLKYTEVGIKTIYNNHSLKKDKRQSLYNGLATFFKLVFSI